MSKCRYNLSEDCNNTDCLNCVLDKIRAEIERKANSGQWSEAVVYGMKKSIVIIDKYKAESEE